MSSISRSTCASEMGVSVLTSNSDISMVSNSTVNSGKLTYKIRSSRSYTMDYLTNTNFEDYSDDDDHSTVKDDPDLLVPSVSPEETGDASHLKLADIYAHSNVKNQIRRSTHSVTDLDSGFVKFPHLSSVSSSANISHAPSSALSIPPLDLSLLNRKSSQPALREVCPRKRSDVILENLRQNGIISSRSASNANVSGLLSPVDKDPKTPRTKTTFLPPLFNSGDTKENDTPFDSLSRKDSGLYTQHKRERIMEKFSLGNAVLSPRVSKRNKVDKGIKIDKKKQKKATVQSKHKMKRI